MQSCVYEAVFGSGIYPLFKTEERGEMRRSCFPHLLAGIRVSFDCFAFAVFSRATMS